MLSAAIALAAVAAVGLIVWFLGARDRAAEQVTLPLLLPSQRRSVSPDEAGIFQTELRARYEAELVERERQSQA
jgi:hypothetical protein